MPTDLETPVLDTPATAPAAAPEPVAPAPAATPEPAAQPDNSQQQTAAPSGESQGVHGTGQTTGLLQAEMDRRAAEKKAAEEGGGDDAPTARGPDGKFLPKDGAKPAEPAAGAPAAPAADTPPTIEELEKTIPGMGGKDKKRYTAWIASQKAIQAKADAAEARAKEFETKARDYEAKAATPPTLPKEEQERIAMLERRSRQWDITTDPKFQRDYDAPIAASTERMEKVLTDAWRALGITDDKIKPQLEIYRKAGFNWKDIGAEIAGLADKKMHGEAEELRALVREKDDLGRKRTQEIEKQLADNNTASAQRAEQSKAQQAAQARMQDLARESTNSGFTAIEGELKKLLPMLVAPDAPADKDSAAIVQSKRAAQAEYQKAIASIRDEFARFAPDPNDLDKTAKLTGEFQSLVLLGLLAKTHLLPRAAKEIAARDAQMAELNTRLGAFKKAGAVNSSHLAAAQEPKNGERSLGAVVPNSTLGDGRTLEATLAAMAQKASGGIR